MSLGHARQHSNSAMGSSIRTDVKFQIPTPSITPQNDEFAFQPCAATGSFLLYAQQNIIYCLHHDTLAIERRFERHREDVSWISTDNVSERGAGRLVLSYDTGSTAIVWDLLTGDEVARFASYEQIRVATWMRNGNVAFGEYQGAGSRLPKLELMMQQAMHKATSSCSSLPLPSTSQQERFSTQSLRSHQLQTVAHLQSGMCTGPDRTKSADSAQLPQWLNSHCNTTALVHNSPHSHNSSNSLSYCGASLAWILFKTEV
jgi:hypothetical protein